MAKKDINKTEKAEKKPGYSCWVYHKTQDAKIIDSNDLAQAKKDGWKEAPVNDSK